MLTLFGIVVTPDIINAIFELFGAAFLTINVIKIRREKMLRGVSVLPCIFFTSWGFWNVFFYPTIGQFWSAVAGVLVLLVNLVWLYYTYKYRNN